METIVKRAWLDKGDIRIITSERFDKAAPWCDDGQRENWNNHKVAIKYGGKSLSFDYWCSIARPNFEKRNDLLCAFMNFLDDALSGQENFKYFASNFGYSDDSIKALKIYQACQKHLKKALRLFTQEEIEKIINDFRDMGL